jgi:hypothetical protein
MTKIKLTLNQKKLKLFMKLKGKRVKKLTGEDFKCSDKAIASLSDEIYEKLKEGIVNNVSVCGLYTDTCPFCLAHYVESAKYIETCPGCAWEKENYNCNAANSVYKKVLHDLFSPERAFPNKAYKSIINKCEKIKE